MSGVFRPQITRYIDERGKRVKKGTPGAKKVVSRSKTWWFRYRDKDNKLKRVAGKSDKSATNQMLVALEKKVTRQQTGNDDPFEDHRKRPLTEHLSDFKVGLEAKGNTSEYVEMTCGRIEAVLFEGLSFSQQEKSKSRPRCIRKRVQRPEKKPSGEVRKDSKTLLTRVEACKFKFIRDLSASRVSAWLAEARRAGTSIATSNHYLRSIKGFSRWLVRDRRTGDDPLAHLQTLNSATDVRIARRCLATWEFDAFIEATEAGAAFCGLSGSDRNALYLTASFTGFRASELASLAPESFDLDANPPKVTVEAAYSKHRRRDEQPLPAGIVAILRPWLAVRPKGEPCWPGSWVRNQSAKMVRRDLAAARTAWIAGGTGEAEQKARTDSFTLKYRDASGHQFDFHALRHQFISSLATSGVHPRTAQSLARHSSIDLTMNCYTHLGLADLAAAVETLPCPAVPTEGRGLEQEAKKAAEADARDPQAIDFGWFSGCAPACISLQDGASGPQITTEEGGSLETKKAPVFGALFSALQSLAAVCSEYPHGDSNPGYRTENPVS